MKTFEELALISPLKRALADGRYERPTPIQAQAVPAALQGRDVLGCAQTGTGKTAAFALPILNRLGQVNRQAVRNRPYVLVLAPTRELAIQIGNSFASYGRHLRLRHALIYGGVSQGNQVRALNRGVHIVVATPGRLLDLMDQRHIRMDRLEVFVLDEADRMLDMGFLPDLKRIISHLPERRQSLFFSATIPQTITRLSKSLLRDPVNVNVTPKSTSVKTIEQRVLFVERSGKRALLIELLTSTDSKQVLVFTRTKRGADALSRQLVRTGIRSTAIHGNKSQNARQRAIDAFRARQVQVLVATDVAARGIDIEGISHVVNFDLPHEPESYVHRIGRTGRAGAAGIALTLCCGEERRELRAIEKLIGMKLKVQSPTARDVPAGGSDKRPLPTRQAQRQSLDSTDKNARSKPKRRSRSQARRRRKTKAE